MEKRNTSEEPLMDRGVPLFNFSCTVREQFSHSPGQEMFEFRLVIDILGICVGKIIGTKKKSQFFSVKV